MPTDEKETEKEAAPKDPLESVGISRRRLAYAAPAILLSRKMLYRATSCGKLGAGGACNSRKAS